jgi:hypothetical protein
MAIAANVTHDGASLPSGGSASLVLTKPSGTVQGDLMTVEIICSANVTITPPAGWTQSVNAAGAKAFWKVATSSEGASYTFTRSATTNTIVGHIARHTGCHTVTPVDTASAVSNASGTSVVIPTLTVGATATMLVMMCAVLSNATWTPPGTATEDYDYQPATQTFGVTAAHEAAVAGATGTRTFTASLTGANMGVMWSLIPRSAYDDAVIQDAPWIYGHSDEASGVPIDASGNARALTLPGGSPTYQQTGPSGAADAQTWPDSSGGTEYYAQATGVPSAGPFTLEVWFRLDATPTNPTPLDGLAFGYGNNSRRPVEMYVDTDDKVKLLSSIAGTSNPTVLPASSASSHGVWHHAVGVFNSGVLRKLRIDKVDMASDSPVVSFTSSGIFFIHGGGTDIGGIVDLTNGSAVKMAKWAMYPSALSDARIDAHYDAMPSSGSALSQSPSDTVTLSDTRTAAVRPAKADTVTLTDAAAVTTGKQLTDAVTLTEALTKASKPARADSVSLSDVLALSVGHTLELADTTTLTDSPTAGSGDTLDLADSVALDDAQSAGVHKVLADSVILTDTRSGAGALQLSLADVVTLTDSGTRHETAVSADAVELSDVLTITTRKLLADIVTVDDASASVRAHLIDIADVLTLTDLMRRGAPRDITVTGQLLPARASGALSPSRAAGSLRAARASGSLEGT